MPTLNKENHNKWFKMARAKLLGRRVIYVTKKTLEEATRVATLDLEVAEKDKTLKVVIERLERLSITPSNSTASTLATEKGVVPQVFLNIKKKEKYLKDYRTAILTIMPGLDNNNIAIIDKYPLLKQLWAYLKTKYNKLSKIATIGYRKKL
jgi:hypothetical protein